MHPSSNKLYILVDRTLSKPQQAVQACHAAAEFALKYGKEWTHESLVLLAVENHETLESWYDWFDNQPYYKYIGFREPHYGNRMTAVACYGCDKDVDELTLL